MALARTLETFDPAASRRGLRRANIALHLGSHMGIDDLELASVVVAAQLNEICLLVTHDRHNDSLSPARSVLSSRVLRSSGLDRPADAIHHQFERWGGGGLPGGLAGQKIPLGARILHAVHAYDEPTVASMGWLDPACNNALRELKTHTLQHPTSLGWLNSQLDMFDPHPNTGVRWPVRDLINAAGSVPDVVAVLANRAVDSLAASTVSVAKFEYATDHLRVLVNAGQLGDHDQPRPTDEVYPIQSVPQELFTLGGSQRLVAAGRTADPNQLAYLDQRGLSSEAVAPIMADGTAWGLVWATTFAEQERRLSNQSMVRLREVADDLAVAVSHSEEFAELRDLALRDPLTGLWNRRVLDQRLAAIFAYGHPFANAAVIICDVDELKAVNDSFGHSAGDTVLTEAAASLREATAGLAGVTVCRIGGDEFCVVIEGNADELAQQIVDRALARFKRDDSNRSMSCGISITHPEMTRGGELLAAADKAQYEVKRKRKEELGLPPPQGRSGGARRARRNS